MTLNARGQRRRVRGRAASRYPEDIIAVHEESRPMVGVPGYVAAAQEKRVARYLDNVATHLGGAKPEGAAV
jgi:hypothetical protein